MLISSHTLRGLPVFTEQGSFLGVVCGVTIDTQSQSIMQYEVKSGWRFFHRTFLLIHSTQVISISHEKMVVKDEFMKETHVRPLSLFRKWRLVPTV